MIGSDLIDTRLLRRLTLSAAGLVVLGVIIGLFAAAQPALGWLAAAVLLLALAPLVVLLLQLAAVARSAERQLQAAALQRQENERNQQAILRLLDEMANLADGDLTVQATVNEDITARSPTRSTTRSRHCANW